MKDPLKPVRSWRAFYGPRTWFCGRTLEEAAALPDGILIVVAYEKEDYAPGVPYMRRLSGSDHYFWVGEYVGSLVDFGVNPTHSQPGLWVPDTIISKTYPDATIKKGIWETDEVYEATRKVAMKAMAVP